MKRMIILGLGAAAYIYGMHQLSGVAQTESAQLGGLYTHVVAQPDAVLAQYDH